MTNEPQQASVLKFEEHENGNSGDYKYVKRYAQGGEVTSNDVQSEYIMKSNDTSASALEFGCVTLLNYVEGSSQTRCFRGYLTTSKSVGSTQKTYEYTTLQPDKEMITLKNATVITLAPNH